VIAISSSNHAGFLDLYSSIPLKLLSLLVVEQVSCVEHQQEFLVVQEDWITDIFTDPLSIPHCRSNYNKKDDDDNDDDDQVASNIIVDSASTAAAPNMMIQVVQTDLVQKYLSEICMPPVTKESHYLCQGRDMQKGQRNHHKNKNTTSNIQHNHHHHDHHKHYDEKYNRNEEEEYCCHWRIVIFHTMEDDETCQSNNNGHSCDNCYNNKWYQQQPIVL
jgi:hypothetical protein